MTTDVTYGVTGETNTQPSVWIGKRISAVATTSASSSDPYNVGSPYPSITAAEAADCYLWAEVTTFGNLSTILSQRPPSNGLSHAGSVFVPATGYNTGYYSMFDNQCVGAGPIASGDPTVNKTLAGGVYFDIDRSALGSSENLILNLTFIPMGTNNLDPTGKPYTAEQSAVFKVHLISTGQATDYLQSILQPRYFTYTASAQFPQVVQNLAVLAPPTGEIRQEQIIIPLSTSSSIDRIRVERVSGSAILIDAQLYRMGAQ
jgi:hypothetical protein